MKEVLVADHNNDSLDPIVGAVINSRESIKEVSEEEPILYETRYKKGNLVGDFRFYYKGGLGQAIIAARVYLDKKSLKHLHTTRFIIDLDKDFDEQTRFGV